VFTAALSSDLEKKTARGQPGQRRGVRRGSRGAQGDHEHDAKVN
jgi:hypothetical protein